MSLTASARSSGDTLRQEILIDGRHRLITDEPEHLGGTDEGQWELLRRLVAADFKVVSFHEEPADLEDVFLEITKGAQPQ